MNGKLRQAARESRSQLLCCEGFKLIFDWLAILKWQRCKWPVREATMQIQRGRKVERGPTWISIAELHVLKWIVKTLSSPSSRGQMLFVHSHAVSHSLSHSLIHLLQHCCSSCSSNNNNNNAPRCHLMNVAASATAPVTAACIAASHNAACSRIWWGR